VIQFGVRRLDGALFSPAAKSGIKPPHAKSSMRRAILIFLFALTAPYLISDSTIAQKPQEKRPETWKIDNLKKIGGDSLTITGQPRVTKDTTGKAISFDGKGDGLLVNRNPIEGARVFTIEAIFRPEAGGDFEQRWLHIQDDKIDDRALLELRATGNEWFLDTFIKSGENRLALFAEKFKHPIGPWYHVALVFDGVTMRHYVDGQEEMSGPLTISFLGPGKTFSEFA
jgi:hypothetical protein